jgi:hypothetical protein
MIYFFMFLYIKMFKRKNLFNYEEVEKVELVILKWYNFLINYELTPPNVIRFQDVATQ